MRGDDRGFTLLETLIALIIMSIALAGLSLTFSFARSELERTSSSLEAVDGLQSLRMTIGDALGEVVIATDKERPYGDESSLTVWAPAPRALGAIGAIKTTFHFDPATKRFEGLWESDLPGQSPIHHSLFEGEGLFSFAYSETGDQWLATWEPVTPVHLVKLSATIGGLMGTRETVFSTRIVNSPLCRFSKEHPCAPLR